MPTEPFSRPTPAWLADAIFYEIYPQSFYDSNGDGIGDLPGVTAKLDYLTSLGVNALWLNPCFVSPFGDAGYDISDFYRVAPRYGTNADLKRLFREAHKRGMKVCLDLVAGHTSSEHPWFKESAKPTRNRYSDWFIWTDNVWNSAPGDFKSIQGFGDRDGAYVANFFYFQPALNFGFANPDPKCPWQLPPDHPSCRALREEMMNIMRYWLDQGCDGFRCDMAFCLIKNDPDYNETMKLWSEWRAVYDRDYPECVLIAEWSSPKHALKAGFHIDFMIHGGGPAYNTLTRHELARDAFRNRAYHGPSYFDRTGDGDILAFLEPYLEHYRLTRDLGYISIPTGNHDLVRFAQDRTPEEIKVGLTFFLTMPGVPYLYYGDEIGMRHLDTTSREGGYGRTGARSPMQWNTTRNAGFSTAKPSRLYVPLDPTPSRPNVATQEKDADSLLNHTRALIRLRRENAALGNLGEFTSLHAIERDPLFVYQRKAGSERIIVALNPSGKKARAEFKVVSAIDPTALLAAPGYALQQRGQRATLTLPPAGYSIFRLA
jgi:glycosidase